MPGETNKLVRIRAAFASGACLRRLGLSEYTLKRGIASLVAIGIVLGTSGRGQVRESLAAAVDPQQSPAQTSAPAGGPSRPRR